MAPKSLKILTIIVVHEKMSLRSTIITSASPQKISSKIEDYIYDGL